MHVLLTMYILSVHSVKWVELAGTTYRPGGVVVISSTLMPSFALIMDVLLLGTDSVCMFICRKYTTQCFNSHLHAYEVVESEEQIVVEQNNLQDYHVLSQFKLDTHDDVLFISMKYHIIENI